MDTDEQDDGPTERMKATRSKRSLGEKISKRTHQINGRETEEDRGGWKSKEDREGQRGTGKD